MITAPIKFFADHKLVPRLQQEQVLAQVHENWDKYSCFALSCPTGVGKTYIATALADSVENAYILTSTLQLQAQYEQAWSAIVNLKGRSNYACNLNPSFTVDAAPCLNSPDLFKYCRQHQVCAYYNQRDAAIAAKAMITNPVYMLYSTHCGFAAEEETWVKRSVLIIDEAHKLEEHLVQFAESDVDPEKLHQDFGVATQRLQFNGRPEEDYLTVVKIKELLVLRATELKKQLEKELPKHELNGDLQAWARWITQKAAEKVRKLQVRANALDKVIQPLKVFFATHSTPAELISRWIISRYPDKNVLKLAPIYGDFLFRYYLGKLADKFVFLSATLGTKQAFCKELGISEAECLFVETESPFDPTRSPVIVLPVIKLSRDVYEENVKQVGGLVEDILKLHPGSRGVIHAGTYDLQTRIWNQVSKEARGRLLCRDMEALAGRERSPRKLTNLELLKRHEAGKAVGSVLLSPSMTEGIDLKDDLSDFQVIIKLPWAYLGDERVKRKAELDRAWYTNRMWCSVLQASGRSTRHDEDSSVTYVLDKSFKYFYDQWKHQLPSWFKQRLVF